MHRPIYVFLYRIGSAHLLESDMECKWAKIQETVVLAFSTYFIATKTSIIPRKFLKNEKFSEVLW